MRTRKLLVSAALLTGTAGALVRCHKELPGNPKGSHYDDDAVALPGNPKGSFYDDAATPVAPAATDAGTAAPKK